MSGLELGPNNITLGSFIDNRVWIAVNDSAPVVWCEYFGGST